jgi:hypoxanthine phosphoribosyltransferase
MNFKVINFPGEDTTYIAPTWNDLNDLAFVVSQKIIKDKKQFDRIVTLAKGGWPMTRSMVDFLGVGRVASIGVKFYAHGIYQKLDQPKIYQDLPEPIRRENILLFDDVADSGGSLEFVNKYLLTKKPKSITTATLLYKPWSTFKPDYFGAKTDAWIHFPYDAIQDGVKLLAKKWLEKGLGKSEVEKRLFKLGANPAWVKAYL